MHSLSPDEILEELFNRVKDRYVLADVSTQQESLKNLFPGSKDNVRVLRIKRTSYETASWKTLLFTFEAEQQSIPQCFTWAAVVQEELLNNESSDLYLFIIPKLSAKIPQENCIHIESNDQYCRKYVMRPEETFLELLNRTFLYAQQNEAQIREISDPLVAALDKTGQSIESFTSEYQLVWKDILLSGRHGIETAEALIKASIENTPNDKA